MTQINVNTGGVKNSVSSQILLDKINKFQPVNIIYDAKEVDLKGIAFESLIDSLIEACNKQSYNILLIEESVGGQKNAVVELENGFIIDLSQWSGTISLDIYNNDETVAKKYLKDFMSKYSPAENSDESQIQINFWTFNGKNGVSYQRDLRADSLDEVANNYSEKVFEQIRDLADNYEDRNGKLVIFSGDPGTGKTTIIRSLLREWGDRAKPDYVIDPGNFLVGPPNYMTDLLLKNDSLSSLEEWEEELLEDIIDKSFKKKIIIIEDCGALIKDTAKEETGEGLSRLLNTVDGMIGDGLDILVILTTNEKIDNFHEAVTREGRIHTMIEFTKLTEYESIEWLENHDIEITDEISEKISIGKGLSIAECYDLINKDVEKSVKIKSNNDKKPAIGFI